MALPGFIASNPDRDRIIERCRWLEAFGPESARAASELNLDHSAVWEELRLRGLIREAAPDRFYLDEGMLRRRSTRHLWFTPLLLMLAFAAIWLAVRTWR